VDLDGDLDLAVSQEGGGSNGYYLNHLITPAHITDNYAAKTQLPDNLTYLHVYRPGTANSAYFHSAPQVIGSSNQPTVTVKFQVYDPNGIRNVPGFNALGSPIPLRAFQVEFSLDGGGTWKPATGTLGQDAGAVQSTLPPFSGSGQMPTKSFFLPEGTAIFSVSHTGQNEVLLHLIDPEGSQQELKFNKEGGVQGQRITAAGCYFMNIRADGQWRIIIEPPSSTSVKPAECDTQAQAEPSIIPTRLGTPVTFVWNARADAAISEHALIRVTLVQARPTGSTNRASVAAISPPFRVRATSCEWPHTASLKPTVVERALTPVEFVGSVRATGLVTFEWDFGDGNKGVGQRTYHQYAHDGTYPVTLTVTGQPCPVTRPLVMTTNVRVGTGISPTRLYLPVIYGGGAPAAARSTEVTPPPVTTLTGAERANGTVLSWDPPVDAGAVTAYRVYRQIGDGDFVRLARLSAGSTSYRDAGIHCGALYFVTAVGPGGESAASNQTFYTSSCTGES
jgi:hypothetical protein